MRYGASVLLPLVVAVSLGAGVVWSVVRRSKKVLPRLKSNLSAMDSKRINVLVYHPSAGSKDHAQVLRSLKVHLGNNYAVQQVGAKQLISEPWEDTTALLVISGDPETDLTCVEAFSGEGVRKIRKFVESGGRYMGTCGGAYFGSSEVHFEVGTSKEVRGKRDLAFFPGIARGSTSIGYEPRSMQGAKAASIRYKGQPTTVFCNGGCDFEFYRDAAAHHVEVLGTYCDTNKNAVVGVTVGQGRAVLSGVQAEFPASFFDPSDPCIPALLPSLLLSDAQRVAMFRDILQFLGLKLEENPSEIPPALSTLYLVVQENQFSNVKSTLATLPSPYVSACPGKAHVLKFLPETEWGVVPQVDDSPDKGTILPVVVGRQTTANAAGFESDEYFKHLKTHRLGRLLMCAQTVTSTQTILMDHFMTMKDFPGLTFTAVTQVSGRGRGNNVWVSPYGCLMASIQLQPQSFETLLYIQYIVAISIVHAIRSAPGCTDLDINIKWPNDIYHKKSIKIGGILVSSNLDLDDRNLFHPIVGMGLNLWNAKPTSCVNEIIRQYNEERETKIPYFSREELLARILTQLEENQTKFALQGFSSLQHLYYKYWIHSQQTVKMEEDGSTVVIQGLTKSGYLLATTADGKEYELHPDQNSFDLMQGLIKRK